MPELPEVETVCRGLADRLLGRRFTHVDVRRPDLRIPFPTDLAARLKGRRIESIGRRGKYILIHLDDAQVVIAHLGMSGRMIFGEWAPQGPHDHLVLSIVDGSFLTYSDHRRFGLITLSDDQSLDQHRFFVGMGPEPLDADFDGAVLARRLAGKRTPIKAALLDQRVVAGLGNIYVCEALFHAGISPRRLAHTVQGVRAVRLVAAIRQVLEAAIEAGGSTLRDYAQSSGELGYFQHQFAVYDREGQSCPACDCADTVKRMVQSGRSTYYCAKRQR